MLNSILLFLLVEITGQPSCMFLYMLSVHDIRNAKAIRIIFFLNQQINRTIYSNDRHGQVTYLFVLPPNERYEYLFTITTLSKTHTYCTDPRLSYGKLVFDPRPNAILCEAYPNLCICNPIIFDGYASRKNKHQKEVVKIRFFLFCCC